MGCLPLEINYAVLTRRDNENRKEKSLSSPTHIYILIKIVEKLEMEYQIISKKEESKWVMAVNFSFTPIISIWATH